MFVATMILHMHVVNELITLNIQMQRYLVVELRCNRGMYAYRFYLHSRFVAMTFFTIILKGAWLQFL